MVLVTGGAGSAARDAGALLQSRIRRSAQQKQEENRPHVRKKKRLVQLYGAHCKLEIRFGGERPVTLTWEARAPQLIAVHMES